jgi:hypothetical protein
MTRHVNCCVARGTRLLGQLGVNFPRYANGLATVNVTLFSDVPGCRLARGKNARRRHWRAMMQLGRGASNSYTAHVRQKQLALARATAGADTARPNDHFLDCSMFVVAVGPVAVI